MAGSVGTAYLTLVPKLDEGFAKKAESSLGKSGASGGEKFEGSFSDKLKSGFKKLAGAAIVIKAGQTIGDSFMQAFNGYANFEQLEGGVKKIFGDEVAGTVIDNARKAFSTAGMSANDYMQNVTSFSASLLQSLGGDTAKAAEYANRAMIDMSDNANTYGSNIQDIQNAYQGFAKQNYTMLDNLKLGYGGTKEEMQRLIKDAASMNEEMAALGVTVDKDDMSFGNIVNAISVMQKHMGIAGTTAAEASKTIEGSINAMKGAWDNFLVSLGDPNGNIDQAMRDLANSVLVAGHNILEAAGRIVANVAENLPGWMQSIGDFLVENAPLIGTAVGQVLSDIVNWIVSNLPNILQAAVTMFQGLAAGLLIAAATATYNLITFISESAATVAGAVGQMITAAVTWIGGIVSGIDSRVSSVLSAIGSMISQVPGKVVSFVGQMTQAGAQLIQGMVAGLNPGAVIAKIQSICASAVDAIKSFFGIHSPSRVMRDLFGYVGDGMVLGLEDSEKDVDKAMNRLMDSTYAVADGYAANIGVSGNGIGGTYNFNGITINAKDRSMDEVFAELMAYANRSRVMMGVR